MDLRRLVTRRCGERRGVPGARGRGTVSLSKNDLQLDVHGTGLNVGVVLIQEPGRHFPRGSWGSHDAGARNEIIARMVEDIQRLQTELKFSSFSEREGFDDIYPGLANSSRSQRVPPNRFAIREARSLDEMYFIWRYATIRVWVEIACRTVEGNARARVVVVLNKPVEIS